jgi:tetratricopeptide (TPR) repeat protein
MRPPAQREERMRRAICAVLLLAAAGCATYTSRMQTSRDLYYGGRYDLALAGLTKLVGEASDRDVSLLLVERGKTNLAAGRYDSAIVDLQRAERRFLEIEKTISAAESFKSVILNPTMGEYQPDSHEKIMINAYLCLAYWMKGDRAGAFVERNRIVERLGRYLGDLSEEDRAALDVPFARYLAAVMYEIEGLADDARIEYEAIARSRPEFEPPVIAPESPELIVFAEIARAPVLVSTEIRGYLQKESGGLVGFFYLPGVEGPQIFSMAGLGYVDLKRPGVLFTFAFPRLVEQPRDEGGCRLVVNGMDVGEMKPLDDLEATARAAYARELPRTLFKAALRTSLKVAAQTAFDDDDKGKWVADVAGKLFSAADRADTRSWQTLPAEIRYFRMESSAGVGGVEARRGGRSVPGMRTALEGARKEIVFVPGLP